MSPAVESLCCFSGVALLYCISLLNFYQCGGFRLNFPVAAPYLGLGLV